MSDKQRLTSEQVLDDYFFDLLVEPEEVEPEAVEQPEAENTEAVEPESESSVGDTDAVEIEAEEIDAPSSDGAADTTDVGLDAENGNSSAEECVSSEPQPIQGTSSDVDELPAEDARQENMAAPFDFEQLSESAAEADISYEADIDVELNLSSPLGKVLSWVPQVQEKVEIVSAVPYAEESRPGLEGVQRLLSQMSQIQPEPEPEHDAELDSPVAMPAEAIADVAVQPEEETLLAEPVLQPEPEPVKVEVEVEVDADPVEVEHDPEHAEPEVLVVPETQTGGDEPPEVWQEKQEMDSEFQALFFEVNGVIFAVRLTELGGIHQLGEVNHLLGRPPWYLGLMTNREHQLDVVDTARWVMPEKLISDEHQDEYRYIVMLGESKWGLACDKLHGTETLTEQSVRWREKAGKRPWLAGMVKDKMCALIHVNELISMLKAGLDVKSVI
ncbi:chemotaxis protein CheW [uncultured Photobacterium sp.]|uniref:chemotaxis protein CheW n=1 Tax=uncultured Photobacterium sp. TaxID=173973 RepID=UPI00345D06F1